MDYTRDIIIDGESLSVNANNIRNWAKRTVSKSDTSSKNEPDKMVETKKKKLTKGDIKELAREFGLLEETEINPHLSFLAGDIAYWYEQELSEARLRLEFAARKAVLEAADRQRIVIGDQGKLSWSSQQIMADLIKERNRIIKTEDSKAKKN